MAFTRDSVPDQTGKIIVVTGGNSGIGFEAARVLAAKGATVVLACRDAAKMRAAKERLRAERPAAKVEEIVLDLGSLAAVRTAAAAIAERWPAIDVLVNNAGVMAIPDRKTADGIEMQMGTNHFGHFALTGLLLPRLLAAREARVVTVSSMLHRRGHLVFEDLPRPARYDANKQYAASKLANVLFAKELDRRLKAARLGVISTACHPGYSATNLQFVGPDMEGSSLKRAVMSFANAVLAQSAEIGAEGTLYGATGTDLAGGEYLGPTGPIGLRGHPEKGRTSAEADDREVARKLWEISEELTGVRFAFEVARNQESVSA